MKARRKRASSKELGKSLPGKVVFRAKPTAAKAVQVSGWIEREEEKARRHLRSILAGA